MTVITNGSPQSMAEITPKDGSPQYTSVPTDPGPVLGNTDESPSDPESQMSTGTPRLMLLLFGYYFIISCLLVFAIALLVSLGISHHSLHYKYYRNWYPSLWIATIFCLGLTVHLLFSVKKCWVTLNPPEISADPETVSPFSQLFNFGQPEVYSRIQTHVFALFCFFLLWSTLTIVLTNTQPAMAILPGIIALASLLSSGILYARAWKIIEVHPTWTHTHIGDIDRITGAGQLRL